VGQRNGPARIIRPQAQQSSRSRASTSQGLRTGRSVSGMPPNSEEAAKILGASVSRLKERAHDSWAWDVPVPKPNTWGCDSGKVPSNMKARAQTSVPRKKRATGRAQTPNLFKPTDVSARSLGSQRSSGALHAVLESNANLMGQITNIRSKLKAVNSVMDHAEEEQDGPQGDQGAGNQGKWTPHSNARSSQSKFDQMHQARLAATRELSTPTTQGTCTWRSSKEPKSVSSRAKSRASTPKVYISASARRTLGPAVPLTVPAPIPGAQKIGMQRGAGENGQMRGNGKTSVTMSPAPGTISHRMGMMHRSHNVAALGDIWEGNEVSKLTPFESFRLEKTRAELLVDGPM